MKRQRVRRAIIFISFLFFPLTIYYLSPVLIVMGAAEGIVAGSLLFFALLFIGSLFFGRLFCGWLCPAAGMQEACFIINQKPAKGGKADMIKYAIWLPWLILIVALFIRVGVVIDIDPFYHIPGGISVSQPGDYFVYYSVTGLILVLALTAGKRAFCHYVCWMAPFMIIGLKLKKLKLWPSLRLKTSPELCDDCKRCDKVCPMSLDVNALVKAGLEDYNECVLCGSCVDSCPGKLIKFSFSRRNGK
ncbi:MAG: 4Fe-4S binding protein [Bacillota bacterium]|nr:4Fe-4S binding protein [Bacillota bacterium]